MGGWLGGVGGGSGDQWGGKGKVREGMGRTGEGEGKARDLFWPIFGKVEVKHGPIPAP